MDSPEKLATFLQRAADGDVDDLPRGLSQGLRLILTVKRGLLEDLAAAPAGDVDTALEATARLALSLCSDSTDALTIVETGVLDDLLEGRRRELEASGELVDQADVDRLYGRRGVTLPIDIAPRRP